MKGKVLVGMSGGVDSSVATKLLLDDGYDVAGVTLKLLSTPDGEKRQDIDIEAAQLTAEQLGVEHFVFDLRNEFKERVIDYFIESYTDGLTPNPCFICNRRIKFGLMLEKALSMGFDFVATGHYAKILYDESSDIFRLAKGKDEQKDQSYFLAWLTQKQLSKILFPLSDLVKDDVQKIAKEASLKSFFRSESQDICFVADNDYIKFIEDVSKLKFQSGKFLLSDGSIIGEHKGIHHYTIGQRRGLNLAFGYPVYVLDKDAENNTVTVGSTEELACKGLIAKNVNFIDIDILDRLKFEAVNLYVRTRYRQVAKLAKIMPIECQSNDVVPFIRLKFEVPEKAVAPGQAMVLYSDNKVVAGGIIESVLK